MGVVDTAGVCIWLGGTHLQHMLISISQLQEQEASHLHPISFVFFLHFIAGINLFRPIVTDL